MTRQSTPQRSIFSASNAREVIAASLQAIKEENDYTDEDLGRILGKGEDMARAYRKGTSGMDAFSLLAAWREWNGHFIGPIRRFVEGSRPVPTDDRASAHAILQAAVTMSDALTTCDEIDLEAVRANRKQLEKARDAIDEQLAKLRPAA